MGVESLRSKLGVKVAGMYPPKPVASFAHFGFDENLMNAIRKSEFEHPTPIQAQVGASSNWGGEEGKCMD